MCCLTENMVDVRMCKYADVQMIKLYSLQSICTSAYLHIRTSTSFPVFIFPITLPQYSFYRLDSLVNGPVVLIAKNNKGSSILYKTIEDGIVAMPPAVVINDLTAFGVNHQAPA